VTFEENFPSLKGYDLTDISKTGLTVEKEDVEKFCLDKQKVREALQKYLTNSPNTINMIETELRLNNICLICGKLMGNDIHTESYPNPLSKTEIRVNVHIHCLLKFNDKKAKGYSALDMMNEVDDG
jgi:hypothetical protein